METLKSHESYASERPAVGCIDWLGVSVGTLFCEGDLGNVEFDVHTRATACLDRSRHTNPIAALKNLKLRIRINRNREKYLVERVASM